VLPGTGTPEPGGMTFQELAGVLASLLSRLTVVGMDVVELAPNLDPTGVSAVVAAKVMRECLIGLDRSLHHRDGSPVRIPGRGVEQPFYKINKD
jgi:arginase family enzyme